MAVEKQLDFAAGAAKLFTLLCFAFLYIVVLFLLVTGTVFVEDIACRLVEFSLFLLQLCPRSTPFLTGVARQLAAVDGKHVAPNQAFRIADQQHLYNNCWICSQLVETKSASVV